MHASGIKKSNLMFTDSNFNDSVFPPITAPVAYLMSNLLRTLLIRGRRLKKQGAYFKKRSRVIHIKFENFFIASFQITANNHYDI